MDRVCFRENKYYSEKNIRTILKRNDISIIELIKELVSRSVLKKIDDLYKFQYVGLVIYKEILIFISPKYEKHEITIQNQNKIIRLFKEYSSRESLDIEETEFLGYNTDSKNNILGIIDYIIDDYNENGLYINEESQTQINGNGRVDWNKTIERNNVFWNKANQPIYIEMVTNILDANESLIITNIHKYVLNECINILNRLGLREVLGYEELYFELDDSFFEDINEMLFCLEKEFDNQFIDRKIELLKAMIAFIERVNLNGEDQEIQFYGTRYFHVIWEKTLAFVFDNKYDKYKSQIPNPNWIKNGMTISNYKETLRPDILVYYKKIDTFVILDAKYYDFSFDENGQLKGKPPGIGDIVKQFAYESIFKNRFKCIENIFLIPTDKQTSLAGKVELKLFDANNQIKVISMNANEVFKMYINRGKYDEEFFVRLLN